MNDSKLWTPPKGVAQLRLRTRKKSVTLPDGRRALITIDDSQTVKQVETEESLDAIVRPRTVTVQIRNKR